VVEAYKRALEADPVRRLEGSSGQPRGGRAAARGDCELFVEAIVAPKFTVEAVAGSREEDLRLLESRRPAGCRQAVRTLNQVSADF